MNASLVNQSFFSNQIIFYTIAVIVAIIALVAIIKKAIKAAFTIAIIAVAIAYFSPLTFDTIKNAVPKDYSIAVADNKIDIKIKDKTIELDKNSVKSIKITTDDKGDYKLEIKAKDKNKDVSIRIPQYLVQLIKDATAKLSIPLTIEHQ